MARAFGTVPRRKIRVRIQTTNGQKVETTQSFAVYGHDAEAVAKIVEVALDTAFGADGNEDEDEEEASYVPTRKIRNPVLTIKKKRA